MRSLLLRVVTVVLAIAALAGGTFKAWESEQQIVAARSASATFDLQARRLSAGLADLRAALQAYVAEGQNPGVWQKTATDLQQSVGAQATALREVARSPDGQGSLEAVLEGLSGLTRTDARAREYMASAQNLSASDVLFAEAGPRIVKLAQSVEKAIEHERSHDARDAHALRVQQLTYLGAGAGLALLAMLALLPVPSAKQQVDAEGAAVDETAGGFGHLAGPKPSLNPAADALIQPAAPAPAPPDTSLADTAALCAALARVQEPQELPALLERAARILNAAGVVVWMPDGPGGSLRPALAHGYTPVTLARMGTLSVDADTVTAVAFRTRSTQVVPAEAGGSGAVVAPLVTADGCSGVMAAEIKDDVPTDRAQALTGIIAAQFATLITPSTSA